MAWLSQFLLGRPGFEYAFALNPASMDIEDESVLVVNRVLNGDLKKGYIKTSVPTIRIKSNYLTKGDRDKIASMLAITSTFLSFQVRDDLQMVLEENAPTDTTHVTIQNNSATRLSAALVAAGKPSVITVNGVFHAADGSGTNYLTGGSYADATRVITLGATLPDTNTVYVTYTYKGWLVNLTRVPTTAQGGWIDKFTYDFQLEGA